MASEVEKWAADTWGAGSPQHRAHIAFASHRCPNCGSPLVSSARSPMFRRCGTCKLDWFAQHPEPDGSAKRGSLIAAFRWSDAGQSRGQ